MWTRKELKKTAKIRFKANYWKALLVGLLIAVIAGGSSFEYKFGKDDFKGIVKESTHHEDEKNVVIETPEDVTNYIKEKMPYSEVTSELDDAIDEFTNGINKDEAGIIIAVIVIIVLVVVLFGTAMGLALKAFVFNPLELGGRKFFLQNLEREAELDLVISGFKHEYGNCVKIMFFRDLYAFLWSLLFIIPGIVKSYEYRMIKYIIAENPSIDMNEAFALSKEMMMGNKWDAFVLDLSFILWHILSGVTAGIVGIFYVNPYVAQTDAALYAALKKTDGTTEYSNYIEVE